MAVRLTAIGLVVGAVSGFFGIGGGFLIVPGLMLGTGMPIINAVGSSLLSGAAVAPTRPANNALSGWVDGPLAAVFIAGGMGGGLGGAQLARNLAARRGVLNRIFACLIFV